VIQAKDLNGDISARFDAADLQTIAEKVDENVSDVESLDSKADALEDQLGGVSFGLDANGRPRITYSNGEETKEMNIGGGELKQEKIGTWSFSIPEQYANGTKTQSFTVSQDIIDRNPIFIARTTSASGNEMYITAPYVTVSGNTVTANVYLGISGAGRGKSCKSSGEVLAIYMQ